MDWFFKNKKVLITGNTGFKGAWLSQILLRMGADVYGVALEPEKPLNLYSILKQKDRVKDHFVDVRDFHGLQRVFDEVQPEIVLHLAAQPIVIDSYKQPRYTYEVNVMGTVNVCECVRLTKSVRSFVNVTTDKVYQNNGWEYSYREIDRLNGYDPYSNSKSCSELVTESYRKAFFDTQGIAVSTCRAGNVVGGGDFSEYRILPDCYRSAMINEKISVRNPDAIRPYQHVLEADFFYLLVTKTQLQDPSYAASYNVGPEYTDCITTARLCDYFCKYWGDGASWKSVAYNGPHEDKVLKLDTTKAGARLGWKPVWNAETAIEKATDWYKTYASGKDMVRFTDDQIEQYLDESPLW